MSLSRRNWKWFGFEVVFFISLFVLLNSHLVRSESPGATELNNEGVKSAEAGDFETAVKKLEQSYQIKPDKQVAHNISKILFDWAVKLHKQSRSDEAVQKLREAVARDSSNGPAWYFLGDITYLKKSDFDGALKAWKRALETAPNNVRPQIVERISRAEIDQGLERNFASKESPHFIARFPATVQSSSVESIISVLETEYQKLANELKAETGKLTVIIYPKSSFERLNSRFDWAIGFYDGRIRIREDDLNSDLENTILPHELAHAFLQHGFGENVPTWVHEGYAQTREPARDLANDEQEILQGIKNRTRWIPLEWIDKRFSQPVDSDDITRAYLESRWVVTTMIQKFGTESFRSFLNGLAKGKAVKDAFDSSFQGVKWSAFSQGSLPESD